MRLVRTATALAVAGSLFALGSSQAATVAVCNLVTDPAGDTFLLRSQETPGLYGPQEDALDIVSADVASNSKVVTAVIRVKKLATTIATGKAQGYELQFAVGDTENLYMSATGAGDAFTFNAGFRPGTTNTATSLGAAEGVIDLAKNEIRITAPLAAFADHGVKDGVSVTMGSVTASRNLVAVNVFADAATGGATYKLGKKSCVTPGK